MYNDQLAKNNPTSLNSKVNYSEVAKLAGVNGTVTKITSYSTLYDTSATEDSNANLTKYGYSRRVDGLTYIAENGIHVRYLYDDKNNEIYKITNDTVYTPLEEYIKDYEQTIKKLIDDKVITGMWQQRYDYAKYYLNYQKEHGGEDTFLKVDPNFLNENIEGKDLFWQPYYITNGKNGGGVKGSTSTLLFATPNTGNESSNIHNRWYAYLVYFNGHVYRSTEIHDKEYQSNISVLGNGEFNSDEIVEKWLEDPANGFEEVEY